MHPEEYIKEVEQSRRLRKIWKGLILSGMLLTGFYIVAPFIHEVSHIFLLELFNCSYTQIWSLSFSGLNGSIQPLCALGTGKMVSFYSIGYLSVILVGGLIGAVGIERHNSFLQNQVLTVTAIGFLLSLIVTVETKGDMRNILDLLGLDPVYGRLITFLVLLGASSIIYLLAHNFLDQNGSAAANGRL